MKVEAVTVCIDYGPTLQQCISNANFLDRWVIVTVDRDEKTRQLCRDIPNVQVICSERIYENGAAFAKGKAINEGLAKLDKTDWLLHLDADVKLPYNFRRVINPPPHGVWIPDPSIGSAVKRTEQLDTEIFYGSMRYREDGTQNQELIPETNEPFDFIGQKIMNGYFQLWHSSMEKTYPEDSNDARQDDMDHFARWPIEKREFLPLKVIDIDEEHNRNHFGIK